MEATPPPLAGIRVLAAINGLELYGHERENIAILESLRRMGAEVMVATNAARSDGRAGGFVGERVRALGFPTISLPFGNQWSKKWLFRYPLSIFEKLWQLARCSAGFHLAIRRFRPTHLHLGSPLAYSFIAPALALSRLPLVYRAGDAPPVDSPFNLPIWKRAVRRASSVVPVSEFIQREIGRVAGPTIGARCAMIHPVARPRAASPGPRAPARRIAFAGQLSRAKGVAMLLESFEGLLHEHPDLELDLCGDGPERDELVALADSLGVKGKVHFHGFVEDPGEIFRRSLFQVTPSLVKEAFGLVVLEAKTLGVPSVVFPNGGLPELVRHGVDGFVCRGSSVADLGEAMSWMLSDVADLTRLGLEARRDAEERFSLGRFEEDWRDLYLGKALRPRLPAGSAPEPLNGLRVLAAINGLELFGHERANIELLVALQELGARVLLGVNEQGDGKDVGAMARALGLETYTLPFGNQWSKKWLVRYPWSLFEKAGQVLKCSLRFRAAARAFEPTHVHLGSPLAYSYLAPGLSMTRAPLIYRMGDLPPLGSRFNLVIWRRAMNRARRVVCISEYIHRYAIEQGGAALSGKSLCIYPSIREGALPAALEDERRPNLPRICYVGQLSRHKGVFDLLEAFESVSEEFPDLHLDILGSGPDESLLAEQARRPGLEGRVHFHGFQREPWSTAGDQLLLVVPSIWEEPLGRVVLEAKALGLPALIYPSGGLPELVRHRVDGYVCPKADPQSLAEGLRWMLSPEADLAAMRTAALEDSRTRFGRQAFLASWSSILRETLPPP